jgi:DNA-binding NarL/FixJ family response regulator
MAKTRILIVDDHEVLREGVRSLISRMRPEWEICGEATDGDEAIQLTQDLQPDIVVLDITMPRMSGLEASSKLRRQGVVIPILIFTTHHSDRLSTEVREAGAQGYVLKSEAARNLVLAVDSILAGSTFFGSASKPQPANHKPFKSGPFLCLDLAFEV